MISTPRPVQRPYTWKWLPCFAPEELFSPSEPNKTVTIAVAQLSESATIDGYRHLISLSQLWRLCPLKQVLALRLREDAKVWEVCISMGVGW